MKTTRFPGFPRAALAGMLLLAAGCALGGPEVLDPSPSDPTLGTPERSRRSITALVVSTMTFLDLNLSDPNDGALMRPTGYTLYDAHGRKVMYVRNSTGYRDSEPTTLELDPGRYIVLLDKPDGNPPRFWVRVEPGMITRVDLDRP